MTDALNQVWRNPYVRVVTLLVVAVLLFWLLRWTRAVWGTVLAAWLIAFVLRPVMDWFEQRGLGRAVGVAVVLALLIAILGLVWWLGINVVSQLSLIIAQLPALLEALAELPFRIARALDPTYGATFQSAYSNLADLLERIRTELAPSLERTREALLARLLAGGNTLLQTTTVLVLTLLFLLHFDRYRGAFLRAVPKRHRHIVATLAGQAGFAVGGYVRGQLIIAATVGLAIGVGLALIGVPLAAGLGVLTGIGNMVPFVGPLLAAVPALALAWLEGPTAALLTAALLLTVQMLDGNLLTPLVFSQLIEVDPVVVVVSVVVGGVLFGFWGIVAAVPTAVFATIVYREHYKTSRWYLGDEADEAPSEA